MLVEVALALTVGASFWSGGPEIVVKSSKTATVEGELLVTQDLPGISRVESNGVGTGFVFRANWILTAEHNISINCKLKYNGKEAAKCWKAPGGADIAACFSSQFPVQSAGDLGSTVFSSGQFYLAVGFGCDNHPCPSSAGVAASNQSAGILQFSAKMSENLIALKALDGRCTVVCRGDSGGPLFLIEDGAEVVTAATAVSDLTRGSIVGLIKGKQGVESIIEAFTAETLNWLNNLKETDPTTCGVP